MSSSTSWTSAAIVLDSLDHGESDKILIFFSRDQGRFSGIAKGAKRSKKRFQNKLELFSHLHIDCSEKSSSTLVFIAEADLLDSFPRLRRDMDCYICASFIREIVLAATEERQQDDTLFALLLWSLQAFEDGSPPVDVAIMFLLRLCTCLGYQLPLAHPCRCGRRADNQATFGFHYQHGQLLCPDCLAAEGGSAASLATGTLRLLVSAQSDPLSRLHRLHFSRTARRQALTMLHRYARNLLQREIQSWKAVRELLA